MKLIKTLSGLLSTLVIFCSTAMPVMATVTTITVDNDALPSSGCSNRSTRDFEYITGSNLYNDDARKAPASVYYQYFWDFPNQISSNCTKEVAVYAYLNDADFTDPSAWYYLDNGTDMTCVGYINQDKAKSGWNYVTKEVNFFGSSSSVKIYPSHTQGCYVGADAIRVTYYD